MTHYLIRWEAEPSSSTEGPSIDDLETVHYEVVAADSIGAAYTAVQSDRFPYPERVTSICEVEHHLTDHSDLVDYLQSGGDPDYLIWVAETFSWWLLPTGTDDDSAAIRLEDR